MPEETKKDGSTAVKDAKDTAKVAIDQALIELEALKATNATVKKENDELREELIKVNGLLQSQLRSKLITEVRSISKLSNEQLANMTAEELQDFIETSKQMLPHRKPITFAGETTDDTAPNMTLGDMFAFKRK